MGAKPKLYGGFIMKKLLPIILALALAVTSIIAFGTMFTGAEDPAPETLVFAPDYANGGGEYFAVGEYNGSDFSTSPIYDAKNTEKVSDQWWPYCDGSGNPYNDFYQFYNAEIGADTLRAAMSADAKVIGLIFKDWVYPTITFFAPVSGTYTFNMGLAMRDPAWGSGNGQMAEWDIVRMNAYTTKPGEKFVAVTGKPGNENGLQADGLFVKTNNTSNINPFSFTVTVEAGERVDFYLCYAGYQNGGGAQQFFVKDLTATLDLSTIPTDTYTAAISASAESVRKNETITVDVEIGNAAFNASEIAVNFDDANFDFVSASAGTAEVTEEGKVVVENYGAANEAGTKISLTFRATSNTTDTATFTLASAKASTAANAENKNLADAFIITDAVTVELLAAKYNVTIADIFTGASEAYEGTDYTFTVNADGAHYNYDDITVTVGGVEVEITGDAENGWTIAGEDITGAIEIIGTRTAKTFTITFVDIDATEEGEDFGVVSPVLTATYGQPYTFTLKANQDANPETLENGWNYNLKSVVYAGEGGAAVEYTVDTENNRLVTIDGTKITADIIITVEKEILRVDEVNVTVTGDGASEVTFEAKAGIGEDYTFTLTPAEGYTYEVFYTMGADEEIKLDGTTSFTIEAVDGHITIRVTKVLTATVTTVTEYVNVNGGTVYLVFVDADKLTTGNYTIAYGENAAAAMYYVNQYEGYAFLVVATGEEDPTEFDYTLAIDTSREALVVEASYDVNESRNVDANDAQLVYNIYNAGVEGEMMYDGFTDRVTLVKYLRADVNNSKTVDSSDATAIVAELFK